MAIRSRAPKAWPILTVAACPSPSGTMKAREPICSATVWASSVAGPISPMTSVAAQKTPTSAAIIAPIGRPSRQSAASSPQSGRQGGENRRRRRIRGSITEYAMRSANISVCDSVVAKPEPMIPSAGMPNLPKMRA